MWFCRLFQEHLSVFQQHFSVIQRHSFVFQWHFFAVFQDDPNCHHGRVLLCHGHHRQLHKWADLQEVIWNCCSFGLKAMIILVITILQLHDVGAFVCWSRWWLNKNKQTKFLEKHTAVLATLSVLIRRVAKVVDWWWLWLSSHLIVSFNQVRLLRQLRSWCSLLCCRLPYCPDHFQGRFHFNFHFQLHFHFHFLSAMLSASSLSCSLSRSCTRVWYLLSSFSCLNTWNHHHFNFYISKVSTNS